MNRFLLTLLAAAIGTSPAWAVTEKSAFGTLSRGATVCTGPLTPTDSAGVQLVGSTDGTSKLVWQVYSTSSETADALVYSVSATSVEQTVATSGSLLYKACVTRGPRGGADFDLTLNSEVP